MIVSSFICNEIIGQPWWLFLADGILKLQKELPYCKSCCIQTRTMSTIDPKSGYCSYGTEHNPSPSKGKNGLILHLRLMDRTFAVELLVVYISFTDPITVEIADSKILIEKHFGRKDGCKLYFASKRENKNVVFDIFSHMGCWAVYPRINTGHERGTLATANSRERTWGSYNPAMCLPTWANQHGGIQWAENKSDSAGFPMWLFATAIRKYLRTCYY